MKNAHYKPSVIAICFLAVLFFGCSFLTSKPQLPVMVGTALPASKEIGPNDTAEVIEVAQWIPQNYSGFVSALDISQDGKFVAAGFSEGSASILDPDTGNEIHSISDKEHGAVNAVQFIPNTNELLLGYDDGTIILSQVDGTTIWEIDSDSCVQQLSISPAGKAIAASCWGFVQVLSTLDGRLIETLEGTSADFLSDEQLILGTSHGQVELWQLDPMMLVTTLDRANENSTDVLLSPSKKIVLANSENSRSSGDVRLMRVEDGHYITALWATRQLTDIAFSPDSAIIATASLEDAAIQLWRTQDGAMLSRLLGHTMPAQTLAFSPDGKLLLSGSYDGTIRVWGLP